MNRIVWRRVIGIVAALGFVGALVGFLVASPGLILTSARPPHSALTTIGLHYTFKQSVKQGASKVIVPVDLNLDDPGPIRLGGEHFANTCVSCHGEPRLGQSLLALSMRPAPQHLPDEVGQFSDAELFWIIIEGVQLAPMPAWPADGNFREIWALVAFLRHLPDMSADEPAALRAEAPGDAPVTLWGTTGSAASVSMEARSSRVSEYADTVPSTGWRPIDLDQRPVERCVACHGKYGSGVAIGRRAPNLTILDPETIAAALHSYAEG